MSVAKINMTSSSSSSVSKKPTDGKLKTFAAISAVLFALAILGGEVFHFHFWTERTGAVGAHAVSDPNHAWTMLNYYPLYSGIEKLASFLSGFLLVGLLVFGIAVASASIRGEKALRDKRFLGLIALLIGAFVTAFALSVVASIQTSDHEEQNRNYIATDLQHWSKERYGIELSRQNAEDLMDTTGGYSSIDIPGHKGLHLFNPDSSKNFDPTKNEKLLLSDSSHHTELDRK